MKVAQGRSPRAPEVGLKGARRDTVATFQLQERERKDGEKYLVLLKDGRVYGKAVDLRWVTKKIAQVTIWRAGDNKLMSVTCALEEEDRYGH